MAKSKNGEVVSNLDVVNVDLQASFESVLNLDAEVKAYEKALSMLNAGSISFRGIKATIEESEKKGAMPTLKPSHAQYFEASSRVRALEGGKSRTLKEILNVTIQAKRAFKKDFEDKLAEAETFAKFAKSIPSQGERSGGGRKNWKEIDNIDDLVLAFNMLAEKMDDLTPYAQEEYERFLKFVAVMSKQVRKNHPAGRGLKVA